jgi:hypothetical protein
MRVVWWLTSILAVSIALGVFFFVASAFVTGGNRGLEGPLGLVMLVSMIGTLSSGILLLMIGPTAIVDHFRRTRVRRPSDHGGLCHTIDTCTGHDAQGVGLQTRESVSVRGKGWTR